MTSMYDVLRASKGLPVDDIFAELWGRKLSEGYTIVTYTGTLPAVLTGTKAGYLHGYKIYGNLTQNGTPTPETPIVPSECGERTENLFDVSNFTLVQVTSTAYRYGTSLGVLPQGEYTFNATKSSGAQSIYLTAKLNSVYSQTTISTVPFTFTADGDSEYIIRTANNTGTTWEAEKYSDMILNLGSTPLPYEPYGYKLPLSSAGQSVDIYLGEATSTRQIRKLVLTGDETGTWYRNTVVLSGNAYYNPSVNNGYKANSGIGYCTHYPLATRVSATIGVYFGSGVNFITDFSEGIDTAEKWKTYLRQQYANGTPVTVWYVLATPTTGTLNEPLRKIGDYVDAIDSTQTSAQIPTLDNSTTISWDGSGLAPSQVEFEYERRR